MLEHIITFGDLAEMSIDDVEEWNETLDAWQDAERRAQKKAESK